MIIAPSIYKTNKITDPWKMAASFWLADLYALLQNNRFSSLVVRGQEQAGYLKNQFVLSVINHHNKTPVTGRQKKNKIKTFLKKNLHKCVYIYFSMHIFILFFLYVNVGRGIRHLQPYSSFWKNRTNFEFYSLHKQERKVKFSWNLFLYTRGGNSHPHGNECS